MGKQIRFFMYGQDEIAFLEEIKSKKDVLVLNEKVEVINETKMDKNTPKSFFLTRKLSTIKKKESGLIDQLISDVIQFIRSPIKMVISYGREVFGFN